MDAGQEPPEDGSEAPTQMLPVVADGETIEMPPSSMPDDSFLQDAMAVAGPASQQRGEGRTWKVAVGAVVLVALSIVIVVFVGYVIQLGPSSPPAGAKPTFPEAARSSRVTAASPSAQPVAPGASGTAGAADPSPTASVAPATSPPAVPTSTPAGSPLRTFSSAGGTILAGCSGSGAYLASWQEAADYRVKWVTAGPAVEAAVTFKAQSTEITMTVICTSGVPVVSTFSKFG